MKLKKAQAIMAIYDQIEEAEPDISTERLLATAAFKYGNDVDEGDVVTAMLKARPEQCEPVQNPRRSRK